MSAISHLSASRFGVFDSIGLEFVDGINVFIGENATGKSQLLKLLYVLHRSRSTDELESKLQGVFRPDNFGRLVHRRDEKKRAEVELRLKDGTEREFRLTTNGRINSSEPERGDDHEAQSVFLPTRELLALSEGFTALYENREISFDETYYDTCKLLALPALKGPRAAAARTLMHGLAEALGGTVSQKNGRFYVQRSEGGVEVELEANLVSEGLRKVATLIRLITNGSLTKNGVLLWDEPEANMNPRLVRDLVRFLQNIAAQGVQVFIATHDSLLCQRLSLPAERGLRGPAVRFFGLYRDQKDVVRAEVADTLAELDHNPLFAEFREFRMEQARMLGVADE